MLTTATFPFSSLPTRLPHPPSQHLPTSLVQTLPSSGFPVSCIFWQWLSWRWCRCRQSQMSSGCVARSVLTLNQSTSSRLMVRLSALLLQRAVGQFADYRQWHALLLCSSCIAFSPVTLDGKLCCTASSDGSECIFPDSGTM